MAWADGLPYDVTYTTTTGAPRTLGAMAYRVLLKLANVADENGQRAWRAKVTVADELGVSPRSIQRAYRELESAGLIRPGDQRFVAHLRADLRPTVYDLALPRSTPVPLWITPRNGETELSTGETTAVATGETTAVARTTQRTNQEGPSATTDRACPRVRAGKRHLLDERGYCIACLTDPATGRTI
jgi:DNA-binding transcriptional MocR family regulator